MRIEAARVLLTGATGGLGRAIARALAERGGELVLTGRRAEVLEPLATEVNGRALACDLADPAAVERLVTGAGEIDILVANAGISAGGRLDKFSVEEIDHALSVNLRAPMVLARRLMDGMVARRRGHLVFVSSLSGKAASPGTAVYSATKFGLRGFALGAQQDLARHGVGVSVVLPGFISEAGMFHDSGARLPPYLGTKRPGDVARAVVEAIERNRAEVDVAPLMLRAGAALAGLAPGPASTIQRKFGGGTVSESVVAGQARKR